MGRTKYAAESKLKRDLRDRGRVDGTPGEISAETRLADVAEAWFAALADRAPSAQLARSARDGIDLAQSLVVHVHTGPQSPARTLIGHVHAFRAERGRLPSYRLTIGTRSVPQRDPSTGTASPPGGA